MDLLEDIRSKLPAIQSHPSEEGIKAALRHVEVAERWLLRGRDEKDEDLFNDVIYRTNQAFEGMLKEAFTVLASQDGSSLSTYKIENHLVSSNILSDRVMALFTNYRQEWRNKSTHDHKLFFSEQEALLAIVSVSAFATILIDQIIEFTSAQAEKEKVENRKAELTAEIDSAKKSSFREEVISLLMLFGNELSNEIDGQTEMREVELIGRMVGFIQTVDPSINIMREPILSDGRSRADLILSRGKTNIVVEVKRGSPRWFKSFQERGLSQVMNYMDMSATRHGILYISPYLKGQDMRHDEVFSAKGPQKTTIDMLVPVKPDA
ncbi:MAG: hypothetical protein ABJF88_16750 [Rhodothermales bacterium]